MILGFIAGYVVLQLGLGAAIARRVRSEEDYLVAGRRLGPALATASVFATWFGAEVCVGAAGEVYDHGLGGVAADPFGYGLALVLFGLVVARPLWRARVTTIADLYRSRYSAGVERLVALLMIPGSILWAAAQIRAFGAVVASTTDFLTLQNGLLIAAGVTVAYTSMGGLLADAWTDLLQGGVLLVCLVVLGGAALLEPGALDALAAEATRPSPGAAPSVWARAEAWTVPIVGSLFAQELAARAAGARSERLARRAAVGAGGVYVLAGLLPVAIGLLARQTLPGLNSGETALPAMAGHHLGTVGQGILAGALVSAILSTIDSALLAASGLLSHNLGPAIGMKADLRSARVGVLVLGVVAWVLAGAADSVHGLVEEASAFGSAGFVVAGLGVLFGRRGGAPAAYAALGLGAVGYVLGSYAIGLEAPFIFSLACAAAGWGLGLLPDLIRRPTARR